MKKLSAGHQAAFMLKSVDPAFRCYSIQYLTVPLKKQPGLEVGASLGVLVVC